MDHRRRRGCRHRHSRRVGRGATTYRPLDATGGAQKIPVVMCPTEDGADVGDVAPSVSSISLELTRTLADQVSLYRDEVGYQSVLGPRNWKCFASYGADGNGGVTIYNPHHLSPNTGAAILQNKRVEAINVNWAPACVSCVASQVCPFFPTSRVTFQALGYDVSPSMCQIPRGEIVTRVSSNLVSLDDPAGIRGTANHRVELCVRSPSSIGEESSCTIPITTPTAVRWSRAPFRQANRKSVTLRSTSSNITMRRS